MTRYRFVDSQKADGFPVAAACQAAGVSASAYYEWGRQQDAGPTRAQRVEAGLVDEIRSVHADSGTTYGSPRVHAELRRRGHMVNHKRVERLMRLHDLVGASPRKRVRTTVPASQPEPAPDLLDRDFTPGMPDQRWAGDITYIPPARAGCSSQLYSMSVRAGYWAMPWPSTSALTWSSTAWTPQ